MVMENGFTLTKQLMKVSGLEPKNMVKALKPGQMDIFTKVNLKIVSGVVLEL